MNLTYNPYHSKLGNSQKLIYQQHTSNSYQKENKDTIVVIPLLIGARDRVLENLFF